VLSFSQDKYRTLEYARQMMSEGHAGDAVEAYRRVLYFFPELTDSIARETGHAYRLSQNQEKARYYYNLAFHNEKIPSVKTDLTFDIIHTYILERDYLKARLQLINLRHAGLPVDSKKHSFYSGIVFFQTDNYQKSREAFNTFFGQKDTVFINNIIAEAEKNFNKNPRKAMIMSIVVPGLGQAYVNEYTEAANSFIINSAFLSLYFYVALTYNPIQGFIAVLPWFQRYYIGGIKKAKTLAEEKRQIHKDELLTKILKHSTIDN
jgi:hypothetical protein